LKSPLTKLNLMDKRKILISLFVLFSISIKAQVFNPVKWKTAAVQLSDKQYELTAKATIEPGWHLYSQSVPPDGPIATTFNFEDITGDYSTVGSVSEEKGKTIDDPIFRMKIKFFEKNAIFKQKVTVKSGVKSISGTVEFMVCDDTRCLPPNEVDLIFNLPITAAIGPMVITVAGITKKEIVEVPVEKAKMGNVIEMDPVKGKIKSEVKEETAMSSSQQGNSEEKKEFVSIFFIAFLSGFAALLTPCVFPMIPMTVSFFTKQSKNKAVGIKNAIIYGISIVAIYVLLGTTVTGIFGADALNALATNVWFNIIFFILLIVFAVSFLGAFEIVLPNTWANRVDSKADKGGLAGIFFMALALAIVSFSCTGPIVGTLLVQAASKGGLAPIIGMLGFSLALALPFALFAAFPGWLNSLPKSGGWLNTVKVVLGFLELALAFKFLSQADLVLQGHILEREVFIAIWIAVFGALAFYLFGKFKLPHDSSLSHISVGRLGLGLIVLSFTVYMIPGLWGAPLNLISAFPPPQQYSESPYGVGYAKVGGVTRPTNNDILPEGAHLLAPHDIIVFDDYDKGLAYARKIGKPVLIDFTGWACVNCRKMEQNVWTKPEILKILKNDVVLISLYVDDKRELDAGEVIESQLKPGKQLKYVGQKWSELQTIRYKNNSQPFYVLMDHKEHNIETPIGYTASTEEYCNWLKSGIENFKK
jgi:thiol:disulfide interchange protein